MIASANLLATALGLVGSLIQARYISPEDLGFVRKYSVVASYAIFLSLGLFTILQVEYPTLIGRGESEKAKRTVAIVQSWVLLATSVVCGALLILTIIELSRGNWKVASAWFIQIVAVGSTLYVGYLVCTYRSGLHFERLARGGFASSMAGVLVLPLFLVWPFATLVLRSVAGSIVQASYLHVARPVRVEWCLPRREFVALVKRGLPLFTGTYLRHSFWLTIEIWLMVRVAGNAGVGLFVFAKMIAESASQLLTAVNQVYTPRVAQRFGEKASIRECLKLTKKPVLLNVCIAFVIVALAYIVLPPLIGYAFPKYLDALPLIRIMLLSTFIVAFSLPLYMVVVLESYLTQIVSALLGLGVFVGTTMLLRSIGQSATAVAWGSVAGQCAFALWGLLWLYGRMRRSRADDVHLQ